jgi:hypothetical protein
MSFSTGPQQPLPALSGGAQAKSIGIPDDCRKLCHILQEIGSPDILRVFLDYGDNDSKLDTLAKMGSRKLSRLYGMTENLSAAFIHQCNNLSEELSEPTSPMRDFLSEKVLWLKACLILEACCNGAGPFLGSVMERLHKKVVDQVQQDIMRDLGACEDEDWDCSTCSEAADINFTDDGPVVMKISAMDTNGVAENGATHYLKPHILVPCRLKNIPAGCFPDADAPLLICPNPSDVENPKSSTFILLHKFSVDSDAQHLNPFLVTRCIPTEPALEFHAVLCYSRPGHTANIVKSFLFRTPLPHSEGDTFSFGFWALKKQETEFSELKHGLKLGHALRFDGVDLPAGLKQGCRYIVVQPTSKFSFSVCGPIVCPVVPLAAEVLDRDSPFLVYKRSPIGRYNRKNSTRTHF